MDHYGNTSNEMPQMQIIQNHYDDRDGISEHLTTSVVSDAIPETTTLRD